MPELKAHKKWGHRKGESKGSSKEEREAIWEVEWAGEVDPRCPITPVRPNWCFCLWCAHMLSHHAVSADHRNVASVTLTKSSPASPAFQPSDLCCWLRLTHPSLSSGKMCLNLCPARHAWGMCIAAIQHTLNYMLKKPKMQYATFFVCFCFLGGFCVCLVEFFPPRFLVFAGTGLCLASLPWFKALGP